MSNDDYVIGTSSAEVQRLGLQNAVWRPRALDAWKRAGFTVGQRILDLGCGPGWTTVDLAAVVGNQGRIFGLDRSANFIGHLDDMLARNGIGNVTTGQADFDLDNTWPDELDGAWARWVFAFVTRPRELVAKAVNALRPGGVFVIHEYFDYATWRFAPRCAEQEQFVDIVMRSWRDSGGEPDIALSLPQWLMEAGCEILSTDSIIEVVTPGNFVWEWPAAFIEVNINRLVELGYLASESAASMLAEIRAAAQHPGVRMITPAVMEIVARRL